MWDPALRIFHWLLASTVAGAALTGFFGGATSLDLHIVSGTAIALLLTFRVIWGFTGPVYARFKGFVPAPASLLHHARELLQGGAPHYLGHNPVGSAMILALLAVLAAIIGTGVAVLGGVVKEGPLAPFLSFTAAGQVKEVHELLAFLLLGLVGLHLAGVLGESWRTRENLIRAMVTGTKHARDWRGGGSGSPHAAFHCGLRLRGAHRRCWRGNRLFLLLPAFGVPDKPMDTAYAKECGSCHSAHHPSVAPAATWTAIMGGLAQPFRRERRPRHRPYSPIVRLPR